ncbi:MAG: hypothetical protein LBE75_08560 [Burkholderiales bacterium]|jgi:hypothetical protein|nr:hypothetical protein [Burkholderiales bacterium]
MDIRSLTLLAIKLTGLFFLVNAFAALVQNIQAFAFFPDSDTFFGRAPSPLLFFVYPLIYAATGIILFLASGKIANKVIDTGRIEPSLLTVDRLLSVAIRIVCLYFMFQSLYSLVYHWAEAYWFAPWSPPVDSPRANATLLAAGIQFALALIGWFYSGKLVEITRKFSGSE